MICCVYLWLATLMKLSLFNIFCIGILILTRFWGKSHQCSSTIVLNIIFHIVRVGKKYSFILLAFYQGISGIDYFYYFSYMSNIYTLWISRCIAAARERIPGSIDNYVTGVSECSQQRGNLKDDGYSLFSSPHPVIIGRDDSPVDNCLFFQRE